jgi:uncharacterized tellurite resistance protein B-like protein
MEIPQIDRSNYLKGLLITARKDEQLAESEKEILKKISDRLGFSKDFFEETITTLLANKYITEEPPKFSNNKISQSFVTDALRLALSDNKIGDTELNWILTVANTNGITSEWVNKKLEELKSKPHLIGNLELALYAIL